eukprot:UN02884
MRLEQTEDWNPLAEMIKNFGGKGGSTASLPGESAAASTGALLFDDVSEQSSSYFAVINRLRRNLEESRNECSNDDESSGSRYAKYSGISRRSTKDKRSHKEHNRVDRRICR